MELPLVSLDVSQTRFWWLSPGVRMLVGNVFWKKYGRCVVLSAELDAIAVVEDGGRIRTLDFPYHRYKMWQVANKPAPVDCQCRNFIDMEVGGAWGERNLDQHHPMCIYKQTAETVFSHFHERGIAGITRPDVWTRKEAELVGTETITSAGR